MKPEFILGIGLIIENILKSEQILMKPSDKRRRRNKSRFITKSTIRFMVCIRINWESTLLYSIEINSKTRKHGRRIIRRGMHIIYTFIYNSFLLLYYHYNTFSNFTFMLMIEWTFFLHSLLYSIIIYICYIFIQFIFSKYYYYFCIFIV